MTKPPNVRVPFDSSNSKPPNGRVPLDSSNFEGISTTFSHPILFLLPVVSPSHRLPLLAYLLSFWQNPCYFMCTPYTRRSSTPLLTVSFSLTCLLVPRARLLLRYVTSARRTRWDCDFDFATTSFTARRARPYLTTATELSHRPYLTSRTKLSNRYKARGA